MLRNEMNAEELLSQLEEEIRAISVQHHTGGYEDKQEALLTVKELQVKLFAIPDVVKVESSGTSVFCPECGGELLYVEHDKCTTEGCKNCIF